MLGGADVEKRRRVVNGCRVRSGYSGRQCSVPGGHRRARRGASRESRPLVTVIRQLAGPAKPRCWAYLRQGIV